MSESSGKDYIVRLVGPDDIGMIADVHCQAFGDSFLTLLGKGAVRRYYQWLNEGPFQQCSYVALSGQKVKGFSFSGIFTGATSSYLRKNLAYVVLMVMTQPRLIFNSMFFRRAKTGLSLLLPRKENKKSDAEKNVPLPAEFRILAIAVMPGCQGSGAARMLMEICEKGALERGFGKIGLTVKKDNGRAIKFYEKLGYARVAVSEDGEYQSMEKDIRD